MGDMAPINPGDDSRVCVVVALSQRYAATLVGRLLEPMHYSNWPDHIAGFQAEVLRYRVTSGPEAARRCDTVRRHEGVSGGSPLFGRLPPRT
jgi:hypothetical protein